MRLFSTATVDPFTTSVLRPSRTTFRLKEHPTLRVVHLNGARRSRAEADRVFRRDSAFFSAAGQGGQPLDPRNLDAEYSRGLRDIPHRVVLSPIDELPFGEGKPWASSGAANRIIGGWTVSAIASWESGSPINITQADNTGSYGVVQRPHLTGQDPRTSGSTLDRLNGWIDPAGYQLAAPFTFGTAPRTDPRNRTSPHESG